VLISLDVRVGAVVNDLRAQADVFHGADGA
jgi:hypothetical protein